MVVLSLAYVFANDATLKVMCQVEGPGRWWGPSRLKVRAKAVLGRAVFAAAKVVRSHASIVDAYCMSLKQNFVCHIVVRGV